MSESELINLKLAIKEWCPDYYKNYYLVHFEENDNNNLINKLNIFFESAISDSLYVESIIYSNASDSSKFISIEEKESNEYWKNIGFNGTEFNELINLNFFWGIFNGINYKNNYNRLNFS